MATAAKKQPAKKTSAKKHPPIRKPGAATLGGIHLLVDPSSVTWDFHMKTSVQETVGGRVVQVFGTDLGDMTVTGSFVPVPGKEIWKVQQEFLEQVKKWAEGVQHSSKGTPLRFVFAPRKWDFKVYIRAYTGINGGAAIQDSAGNFAPKWRLTLFVVEDNTRTVVKGIRDAYIARLMAGVGWKQTEYNGPSQNEVTALTAPYGGVGGYLQNEAATAAGGN